MHDIAFIRNHPELLDERLAQRGMPAVSAHVLQLDVLRREAQSALERAQNRRKEASKLIGQAMTRGETSGAQALKTEVAELKENLPALEDAHRSAVVNLDDFLLTLPNLPAEDTPEGIDESDNEEIDRWGVIPKFDFVPLEHADLGPPLGLDFETGTAIAGARFTFLRGDMARLHRALGQFMLDYQTSRGGYTECNPPLLVTSEAAKGTGQLPKFKNDLFATAVSLSEQALKDKYINTMEKWIEEGREFNLKSLNFQAISDEYYKRVKDHEPSRRWLIPTSEVSLTNSVREQILELGSPLRLTALTPCFRSEAGSAGRDTRGYIRQHQFEKVELVSICQPEDAEAEHRHMLHSAQSILEQLGLPYRTMLLCAGDMGFSARKTFDLEVWLPGQGSFREISSVSWCGEFQARRMDARYKPKGQTKGPWPFVHTLNGSGLAVGRTLVAVLENYQQEDGSVLVPEALKPWAGGLEILRPL